MRILVAPAGSRGDVQPLLALAIGLKDAGHDVAFMAAKNFVPEIEAFGVSAHALDYDAEDYVSRLGFDLGSRRGRNKLIDAVRVTLGPIIDFGLPLARGADLVIGGGAQFAAPTLAEAAGVPYIYVAYSPETLWSRHHLPWGLPWRSLPKGINALTWRLYNTTVDRVLAEPVNAKRRALGLLAVVDWYGYFAPRQATLLACDPELAPAAPDSPLPCPPVGALQLFDQRPLPETLGRFLRAGAPPVYIGFGSMNDQTAEETLALFVEAGRTAALRLVVSSGWARFGGEALAQGQARLWNDDVIITGPASHALLFPCMAGIVHHGGAGTIATALRAGRPQLAVPQAFDQFQWAEHLQRAGLGPCAIPKKRLSAARLGVAMADLVKNPDYAARAQAIAKRLAEQNPVETAVRAVTALAHTLRPTRGSATT